jgi:hypothetical protein
MTLALDRRPLLVDHHGERFAVPRPAIPELGVPGTRHWSGYILLDEVVPELIGTRALETFDRMRRSDGTIKALLRALKGPLLSAQIDVDPASEDAQDVAIRDFVRWNLFEGLSHTFKRHLREALTSLDFGFSVFELCWDDRVVEGEQRVVLKKIAPRLQRTIWRWHLARDGGLISVEQNLFVSEGESGYATIPVEKLAVYVNEQEGANWTGQSVLRPAYKHWWMKDQFEKFQAIGAERFSVGIVEVKVGLDQSDDAAALTRAEEIGAGIRAHEKGNVALPNDWSFELKGVDGRPYDLLGPIEYHDLAILRSIHAQFLALGAKGQGSNAMSQDQSSFFLQQERSIADDTADVVNRFIIPKLVDFNWSGVTKYPKLVFRKIETREIEKYFTAIAVLAGQRLLTADDPTEDELRSIAGLPPHDKTTARTRPAPSPAPQPQPAGQPPGTEPPPSPDGGAA